MISPFMYHDHPVLPVTDKIYLYDLIPGNYNRTY